MLKKMKIAKEGLIFIVPALALCIIFLTASLWFPFVVFLIITFSFCYFFRDPKRSLPQNKNMLLAPADGKIVKIQAPHLDFHSKLALKQHVAIGYHSHFRAYQFVGFEESNIFQFKLIEFKGDGSLLPVSDIRSEGIKIGRNILIP